MFSTFIDLHYLQIDLQTALFSITLHSLSLASFGNIITGLNKVHLFYMMNHTLHMFSYCHHIKTLPTLVGTLLVFAV